MWVNFGLQSEASFRGSKIHVLSPTTEKEREPKQALVRWRHARELLGKQYRKSAVKSVVKSGERIETLDKFLNQWTHHALKGRWKRRSSEITQAIIHESNK